MLCEIPECYFQIIFQHIINPFQLYILKFAPTGLLRYFFCYAPVPRGRGKKTALRSLNILLAIHWKSGTSLRIKEWIERSILQKKDKKMKQGIDNCIDNIHTNRMKTAISIPDHIFKEVNKLAQENKTSRSQIFCAAVEEYLKKMKAQKLLEALNSVYADEATPEEKRLRAKTKEYYERKVLEKNKP
jgi:predicted transcriptional regulator